ncbi:hypothetical protein PspLS_09825 [Pyricularia sp. CBS 133598]|nr:hypothetical protein PspLS_09825 [Pyricularia sp. CBS 133598]
MGVGDLFDFNKREYAERVALKTDAELKHHEIRKTRQIYTTQCTMTAGIAAAVLSCGASLGATALGWRKSSIARRKLKMIEDELTRRNIPLHELRYRDVLIPLVFHWVGAGVDFGANDTISSATSTVPLHSQFPSDAYEQLAQHAIADPGHTVYTTVEGALDGVCHQLQEVNHFGTDVTQEVVPGSEEGVETLHQDGDIWAFTKEWRLPQSGDEALLNRASSKMAWMLVEGILALSKAANKGQCLGALGGDVWCNCCGSPIESGKYWRTQLQMYVDVRYL